MLVLDSSSRGKPALNFAERRETKSTSIHNIKCSPLSTTRIIAHTFLNLCLSVSHSHSHSHSLTIIYSLTRSFPCSLLFGLLATLDAATAPARLRVYKEATGFRPGPRDP